MNAIQQPKPVVVSDEDLISEKANLLLRDKKKIKLLEAGCGSASYLNFAATVESVGIDISREQLDRNSVMQVKILGDLQTYPLPAGEFDVVVCRNVIEHLSKPQDALMNMFKAVKPGGLLILSFPNLASFKGIVTKFTPFWFHSVFYRFMKYKFRPFPTYLRLAILPRRVIRLAEANGFSTVLSKMVEGGVTRKFKNRFVLFRLLFSATDKLVQIVSVGHCKSFYLDSCNLIFQKTKSQKTQYLYDRFNVTRPHECQIARKERRLFSRRQCRFNDSGYA